jgi:prevent-host-death family protein
MSIQMNIAEAKAKLSELVARAEAGEDVVIARDGVPVVVLRPANDAPRLTKEQAARRLGALAHLGPVTIAPDAFEPDEEEIAAAEGGPDDPLLGFR